MVVAYLRGLIKSTIDYSYRSILSRELSMEYLSGILHADAMRAQAHATASITPVLTEDGVKESLADMDNMFLRSSELSRMDTFAFDRRRRGNLEELRGKISIVKLFQLMDKNDIMSQLAK